MVLTDVLTALAGRNQDRADEVPPTVPAASDSFAQVWMGTEPAAPPPVEVNTVEGEAVPGAPDQQDHPDANADVRNPADSAEDQREHALWADGPTKKSPQVIAAEPTPKLAGSLREVAQTEVQDAIQLENEPRPTHAPVASPPPTPDFAGNGSRTPLTETALPDFELSPPLERLQTPDEVLQLADGPLVGLAAMDSVRHHSGMVATPASPMPVPRPEPASSRPVPTQRHVPIDGMQAPVTLSQEAGVDPERSESRSSWNKPSVSNEVVVPQPTVAHPAISPSPGRAPTLGPEMQKALALPRAEVTAHVSQRLPASTMPDQTTTKSPSASAPPLPLAAAPALPQAFDVAEKEDAPLAVMLETRHVTHGHAAGTPMPTTLPRAVVPQIAQQMAVALSTSDAGATELTLNPEELGRVRLSLNDIDGVMTVSVLAERAETLDLLRRNLDALGREFRDIGYDDIQFDLGTGSGEHQEDTQSSDQPPPTASVEAAARPDPGPVLIRTGLDLKL